MKITINGDAHEVAGPQITYADIINLAGCPEGAKVRYHRRRPPPSPRDLSQQIVGNLHPGETLDISEDMEFTCAVAGNN